MKQPVYTIGNHSIGFSIESIRNRYTPDKKEEFFDNVLKNHENVSKTELKKVLKRIWDESFPQKENNEKGAE